MKLYSGHIIALRCSRGFLLPLAIMALIIGQASRPSVAEAQGETLTVAITRPSEGETYYAGPSSLLYSTEISGSVWSREFDPDEIEIRLDVLQHGQLIDSLETKLHPDGTFSNYVTVNPDGSEELFGPDILYCANQCHFISKASLAPGPLLLRVTVTDPGGRQAVAERNIIVDISDYAMVPVNVSLAEDGGQAEAGIPVTGSTWLYMWRSRIATGATDDQGKATMRVEALSQAPTRYVFEVEPVVVGGVLYESQESVEVILEPGATSIRPIDLTVSSKLGRINGSIFGVIDQLSEPMAVRAINLPDGAFRLTYADPQGAFVFDELPLEQYLITLDNSSLMLEGYHASNRELDLSNVLEADVQVPLEILDGNLLQGVIMDEEGKPLPFAWITTESLGNTQGVMPDTGTYTLHSLPEGITSLAVSAPGYYSQAQVADFSDGSLSDKEFVLARQKMTTVESWGEGEIVIPREASVDVNDHRFDIQRGWLWGQGGDNEPVNIRAGAVDILVDEGRFALEYLPHEDAWLYLFEGEAKVSSVDGSESLAVSAGQMVNLLNTDNLTVVPYDPVVLAALRSEGTTSPVSLVWEPTLGAQIRDRLAQVGIGTAQVVTFITYFLVVLSIAVVPLLILYWHWRKSRKTA